MGLLQRLIDNLRHVRGPYQVAALAVVAAAVVAFVNTWIAGGVLILGTGSLVYGLAKRPHQLRSASHQDQDVSVVGQGLERVASPEGDERPASATDLNWVMYRHIKSGPTIGLGKAGDIPAKYFLDLREACLDPAQREQLAILLASHIREQINVKNHDGVAVPGSGNAALGLAVAEKLGLNAMVVRDWPYYGSYVETLITRGRVIVVDDVTTQGELIGEVTRRVRDAGFVVTRAFVVVLRREGDGAARLESLNVSLSAVLEAADKDFDDLITAYRRLP